MVMLSEGKARGEVMGGDGLSPECSEAFGDRCGLSLPRTCPEDLPRGVRDHRKVTRETGMIRLVRAKMISQALGVARSERCEDWRSTFTRLSIERKISFDGVPFPWSRSTWETKLNSVRQSETYSKVLMALGYL
ncbi:hypothetical protein CRG98_023788 [Punica granatum]|uniref:Uncharacterized protein n=1 Tax=Punica granatum TaxID=22663 RepID=A0A2I0JIM9_PUNGR|nr:hypothetical protein CRG98_023788 [Punica granatum]